MKTNCSILIFLVSIIVTLCIFSNESIAQNSFSYINTKQNSTIKQKVNGVNYTLTSQIEYKNTGSASSKTFQFENKITFRGMNREIRKVINKSHFEEQTDFDKTEQFDIEELSFSVNENKDEIYLKYLLNLNQQKKTVILTLKKKGEEWKFN
ncbi:MAG: hypothetical protein JXR61_05605 [Prolixibacteraceae bacterium]|nr:hypothetical protein [Prolixibacteraceae bacterium]